ncbi:putative phage tail protein [Anoxybacillus kestanbolensis]|uniref:putative phage tail protein n=1 Tax=Anoxybacillus kestanbolensis TaxID=227476 RepID=UPI003D1C3C0C
MALYNIQSNVTGRGTVQAKVIGVKRIGASALAIGNVTTRSFSRIFQAKANLNSSGIVTTRDFIKRSLVRLSAQGIGRVIVNAETWKFKGIKAQIQGDSKLEFYRYDRDIHKNMRQYLPPYYEQIKQVKAIRQALAPEFIRLQAIIQDIFQQFIIHKATWGLNYLDSSSSGESIEKRRERLMDILANKTLRNQRIEELIGYECEITEQYNDFLADILLTGVRGEPENIEEILEKLDKYFPSHADFQLRYSYLPWNELDEANLTWDQLETYTWNRLETTFLK